MKVSKLIEINYEACDDFAKDLVIHEILAQISETSFPGVRELSTIEVYMAEDSEGERYLKEVKSQAKDDETLSYERSEKWPYVKQKEVK